DEDIEAPWRRAETVEEVANRGQKLRAGAEVARPAEGVALGLFGAKVADLLDLTAFRAGGPVDGGGAAVRIDPPREVGADLLGNGCHLVLHGGFLEDA